MYRTKEVRRLELENFALPFGGDLNERNRWVELAKLVPREKFEETYTENSPTEAMGQRQSPFGWPLVL